MSSVLPVVGLATVTYTCFILHGRRPPRPGWGLVSISGLLLKISACVWIPVVDYLAFCPVFFFINKLCHCSFYLLNPPPPNTTSHLPHSSDHNSADETGIYDQKTKPRLSSFLKSVSVLIEPPDKLWETFWHFLREGTKRSCSVLRFRFNWIIGK